MSSDLGKPHKHVSAGQERTIIVWDLPTRLFHWVLVLLLVVMYATAELGNMDLHMKAGYAVLALVLFRLAWGFVGSTQSRFAAFLAGPTRALAYLRGLLGGRPVFTIGHNPIGGWMVIAMLLMVLAQAGTGLFTSDDVLTEGPLYASVSGSTGALLSMLHRNGFDVLLALVILHVAAALFYRFVKKDDLITPMVTGRKHLPPGHGGAAHKSASPLLALVLLAAAALIVWAIVVLGA